MGEIMKDDILVSLSYGGFSNLVSLINFIFSRIENVSGVFGFYYVEEELEEICLFLKKLKFVVLLLDIKFLLCMLEI